MSQVDDIREWGKNNGFTVGARGVSRDLRSAYESAHSPVGENTVSEPESRVEEVAPKIPTPTLVDRAKELAGKAKMSTVPAAKKRGPKLPRTALDKFLGRGWQFLAQVVNPINPCVGRVLDAQAPVAGMILEDVVKGTIVDTVLQPIARWEDKGEQVFALVGAPMLVAALTSKPHMAPVLIPMLKESLRLWIDIAGPKLELREKQESDFQEKYGKRIDEMISYFMEPFDDMQKARAAKTETVMESEPVTV